MEKTVIIACHTVIDELNAAIKETACPYPVLWVESGLHLHTEALNQRLQKELDKISNVDRVLLAFGYCGNSLLGISTSGFELVFPRVDDCISLLLGSQQARQEMSKEMGTYYLTKGWLQFESNIWDEYNHSIRKYGKALTDRMFKQILGHYKRLAVIDTGAYAVGDFLKLTEEIADTLLLRHQVVPGSLRLLKKLISGPWDDEFVRIAPGECVTLDHLLLDHTDSNLCNIFTIDR